jgi:hypothetical protein
MRVGGDFMLTLGRNHTEIDKYKKNFTFSEYMLNTRLKFFPKHFV